MIRRWLAGFVVLGLMFSAMPVFANSVETMPEGIFALGFKFGFKQAFKRFGASFGTETVSITKDYNVTIMGQDLSPEKFSKDDIIGTLDASYENYGLEFTITTAFGITDKLTVMMIVPVQYVSNIIDFKLNGSNLYMVRDKGGQPVNIVTKTGADNLAGVPNISVSDQVMDAQDFKDVLACKGDSQLCQFQYRPIRDWNRWGVSEIILGLRYKFLETSHWRQGITAFAKMPTGRQPSTDDLVDSNFGDQQMDFGFWYGIDYMPIKELSFNVSFGYTEQLPEVKEWRVYNVTHDETGKVVGKMPLGAAWQKLKLHRDIGGNWDVFAGLSWGILEYLSYANEFYFFWKYQDNYWAAEAVPRDPVSGDEWIPDYRSLEYGTDQSSLALTNSLTFTTLGWVQRGEFPVPLMFAVGYTVDLLGKNFEQNHTIWASLDLVGSIYMFEGADKLDEEGMEDFKLPGRSDGSSDVDGSVAESYENYDTKKDDSSYDKRDSSYYFDPYRNTRFQNGFGNVNKFNW